jgi:hypothetical protein
MLVTLPCGCIDHGHPPIDNVQQPNVLGSTDLFAEITGASLNANRAIIVCGQDSN